MKNFLLALMVVLTTCTLAVAQTTVVRDSIGKVKVTVSLLLIMTWGCMKDVNFII